MHVYNDKIKTNEYKSYNDRTTKDESKRRRMSLVAEQCA